MNKGLTQQGMKELTEADIHILANEMDSEEWRHLNSEDDE